MVRRKDIRSAVASVIKEYDDYKNDKLKLPAYALYVVLGLGVVFLGGLMISNGVTLIVTGESVSTHVGNIATAGGILVVVYGAFLLFSGYNDMQRAEDKIKTKYPLWSKKTNDDDL
jgi:riboflavin transporter FmnP